MDVPEDWTTGTVRANGTELRYYRSGGGPPVVLAHGFYDDGRCWEPLVRDLASDHDVVACDARGHGGSADPGCGYGIDDRIADLAGVVEGLGLEDPVLVGHSMGGSTVAWTAATRPDLPRAVVVVEPAGLFGSPDLDAEERVGVVRERLDGWAERSVEDVAAEFDDRPPRLAERMARARKACSRGIVEIAREGYPPAADAFGEIECPALVLQSDADPSRRARELDAAEALAHGRLVHVPGAGHYVFHDRYDAAYAELRTFLRRAGTASQR